jgi:hypothetical protein
MQTKIILTNPEDSRCRLIKARSRKSRFRRKGVITVSNKKYGLRRLNVRVNSAIKFGDASKEKQKIMSAKEFDSRNAANQDAFEDSTMALVLNSLSLSTSRLLT